jgi:mannitol/fructose-specific phosphotransferase system IIA component (Ntr-type)
LPNASTRRKSFSGSKGRSSNPSTGFVLDHLLLISPGHFRSQKPGENEHYSYLGDGIAVPHVRLDHLVAPELILGLSAESLSFNNDKIQVV